MKLTIDRFEENFAIVELEDGTILNIPKAILPEASKEGDIITILIDKEETSTRRKKIQALESQLFE